jgi:hypothetical protein
MWMRYFSGLFLKIFLANLVVANFSLLNSSSMLVSTFSSFSVFIGFFLPKNYVRALIISFFFSQIETIKTDHFIFDGNFFGKNNRNRKTTSVTQNKILKSTASYFYKRENQELVTSNNKYE